MSPKIDNSEEEVSQFTASCLKAEKIAEKLIARAEQNSFALSAKLDKKGFETAVVKTVISGLLDRGLLNDQRYAELWLRSRLGKKARSPRILLLSLRKKGIDRHSSQKALDKVLDSDTEYTLLLKYVETLEESEISALRSLLKFEGFSLESVTRYFDNF